MGQIRLFTLMLLVAAVAAAVPAATLILRDGRKLVGVIDPNGTDEKQVSIRTTIGMVRIPRANVMKIDQEENVSFTESSADLAVAEGKLERALDLYAKAQQAEPQNARLKKKIEQTREQIDKRNEEFYGTSYAEIQGLINKEQFQEAIQAAEDLKQRVRAQSAQDRAQQLMGEAYIGLARQYKNRVSYSEAENNFKLAMQVMPLNPVPRLELAEMLEISPARKGEAIPLYVEGIKLAEQNTELMKPAELQRHRYQLGKLYRDQKMFDKAADTLLEVMRLDREYQFPQAVDLAVDSYSKIQSASLGSENLDRIMENLKSIIKLRPTEQRAYLLLGRIYFDRKDWTQARQNLDLAVRNSGVTNQAGRLEALYYLGMAERNLGDLNAAAEAFQTILDSRGGNYDITCELGEVRLAQRDYSAAQTLFQQALEMDKDRYRAYLGLGESYQGLSQFKDARENYEAVVERDPENLVAQLQIAQTYFEEEKWDNAVEESVKVLDKAKEAGATTTDTQTTATRTVEAASGGTTVTVVLAKAYTLMGNSNLNTQKANLARENFQAALKEINNYAPALDGIGRTYQADGLHKDAEEYFNRAIQADPKNPDYYLSMGINWHKYRKAHDKALPYYMKYLELGGKDPNVRIWIKEVGGTPPAV